MTPDEEGSLDGDTTMAGRPRPPRPDVSLGDERTLVGVDAAGIDTVMDDIEIVDLEARYKIEGTLGQGGMGAVLLATDTRLERKVAIKRILGEAAPSKASVMRFLTEAKAIAAINHPNIVQIHDYGRAKDGPFLIMEFVDGGSLADRCKQGGLPLDEAVDIACQICDGLAKAHEAGIVHRDIKPANVLLNHDGMPKLTDFGLAKSEATDNGMTITGAVMGTPDFMPPEQRRDASEVDHRSDLWSLAATVYQMVTGRSPRVIRLHELSQTLQPVMARALEDHKDARYQSAHEFRDALRRACSGHGNAAPAVVVEGVLQEGQCRTCGTVTSDVTRKFCRNPQCGAPLRVPCLKCNAPMPVWDGVCGECGGNQPTLVEARRKSLAAKRAEAERLAADLAFEEAVRCVDDIAAESRPEFADLATWATSFVASTAAENDRRRTAAKQSLNDARKHFAAYDYPAAIQSLETIPEPLRDTEAKSLLSQCLSRHQEAEGLIADIAGRIQRKETAGLLPLVERASALRQDRRDLARIREQLRERRDGILARVKAALDVGDTKQATAAIGGAVAADLGADGGELIARVKRAASLETQLAKTVAVAKSDGVVTFEEARHLLATCEEYLRLIPRGAKVQAIAARCREIVNPSLIRNSIGIEFKRIDSGTFTMGQAGSDSTETPHQVTLTKPFYIGIYEVTNAQWKRVMGSVPSKWQWKEDNAPAMVSWSDAVKLCRELSALPDEQRAGRVYRLPTEAEWEYACRGGTTTRYSFGDDDSRLAEYGWFDRNSDGQTHPVGTKKPNPWGLYDMHGNVFEWCSDNYGEYGNGAVIDPQGPPWPPTRVGRGGCWGSPAGDCRSAARIWVAEGNEQFGLGFRVAMSLPGLSPSEERNIVSG